MKKEWEIHFYNDNNEIVEKYPLHHEYETDEEASREAEDIADRYVDGEKITDWTLVKIK